MNLEYAKETNMFICANGYFTIIGTKWNCSPNSKDPFINIAIFYDEVVHYFDINIFGNNYLDINNFCNYCTKIFYQDVDFYQIYDFMKTMKKCAFEVFNVSSISLFCRRKKLLTKPVIICYSECKNKNEAFDVITKSTTPPLDYPGTRREEVYQGLG